MPHIDAVTTLVERMGRTLQFYRLLGFDIPTTADAEGYATIELGNGLRFEWTTEALERSFNPDRKNPTIRGRTGISLRCASTAEVDDNFHTLVNAGHAAELEPFDAPWGSRHCRVLDPDGNAVDLFAPLP